MSNYRQNGRRISGDASISAATQAAIAVEPYIPRPPKDAKLNADELLTWDGLLEMYRDEPEFWRRGDEYLLLVYVRALVRLEKLTMELDAEGYVMENAKGTPVMNPKFSAANALSHQVVLIAQKLRTTPQSRQPAIGRTMTPAEHEVKKRARQAANVTEESDGLLDGFEKIQGRQKLDS